MEMPSKVKCWSAPVPREREVLHSRPVGCGGGGGWRRPQNQRQRSAERGP